MKVIIAAALLLLSSFLMAQQIGQFAPDKAPISFPSNSWGADIMFGEGGFGLGTFYKRAITKEITGFVDLSISETKHAKRHYAAGGYVGFGAYFGESTSNLIGINVRYYYTHLFGGGIENLVGQFRNNFGHFYLSLNVGVMY